MSSWVFISCTYNFTIILTYNFSQAYKTQQNFIRVMSIVVVQMVLMHKTSQLKLFFWCGNFVEGTVPANSPETLRILYVSTKFPHRKIRWNCGVLCTVLMLNEMRFQWLFIKYVSGLVKRNIYFSLLSAFYDLWLLSQNQQI